VRIEIEIDDEDLENAPVALGYAVAAIMGESHFLDEDGKAFSKRMVKRLQALVFALATRPC
jgi:hypothetical protein